MAGPLRPLRPFYEAALALFSAGASPAVVKNKFEGIVSTPTIYRWYHQWAEYKGIESSTQLERKRNRALRRPEYESPIAKMRREAKLRKQKEADDTYGNCDGGEF